MSALRALRKIQDLEKIIFGLSFGFERGKLLNFILRRSRGKGPGEQKHVLGLQEDGRNFPRELTSPDIVLSAKIADLDTPIFTQGRVGVFRFVQDEIGSGLLDVALGNGVGDADRTIGIQACNRTFLFIKLREISVEGAIVCELGSGKFTAVMDADVVSQVPLRAASVG